MSFLKTKKHSGLFGLTQEQYQSIVNEKNIAIKRKKIISARNTATPSSHMSRHRKLDFIKDFTMVTTTSLLSGVIVGTIVTEPSEMLMNPSFVLTFIGVFSMGAGLTFGKDLVEELNYNKVRKQLREIEEQEK